MKKLLYTLLFSSIIWGYDCSAAKEYFKFSLWDDLGPADENYRDMMKPHLKSKGNFVVIDANKYQYAIKMDLSKGPVKIKDVKCALTKFFDEQSLVKKLYPKKYFFQVFILWYRPRLDVAQILIWQMIRVHR